MRITGTKAAEKLTGTSAGDLIEPAGGGDSIDGGAGNDTLSFDNAYYTLPRATVRVDLSAGTASYNIPDGRFGGHSEYLTVANIENVTGSAGYDQITGNAGANALDGGGAADGLYGGGGRDKLIGGDGSDVMDGGTGSDSLYGGEGDDQLTGGAGADTLDGGWGSDWLSYINEVATPSDPGFVIDLVAGKAWHGANTDTLVSIENVTASSGDDWVSGTAVANWFDLGMGSDVAYGLGGNDIIVGASGNDALYGGAGDDLMSGDDGEDWLSGGDGNDQLTEGGSGPGEWSAMYGGNGNDTLGMYGGGEVGANGGAGNDRFEFWGNGTTYCTGGGGVDTYYATTGLLIGTGGFVQIYDFAAGTDKIQSDMLGQPGYSVHVLDWGSNTGIEFTDTATGQTGTLMLMGVHSTAIDTARDFIMA
jgi:Ca2+-binding RTX toxin-like protein